MPAAAKEALTEEAALRPRRQATNGKAASPAKPAAAAAAEAPRAGDNSSRRGGASAAEAAAAEVSWSEAQELALVQAGVSPRALCTPWTGALYLCAPSVKYHAPGTLLCRLVIQRGCALFFKV